MSSRSSAASLTFHAAAENTGKPHTGMLCRRRLQLCSGWRWISIKNSAPATTSCGRENLLRQKCNINPTREPGEFHLFHSCANVLLGSNAHHSSSVSAKGSFLCFHTLLWSDVCGGGKVAPLFMKLCCWWHLPHPPPRPEEEAESIAALPMSSVCH